MQMEEVETKLRAQSIVPTDFGRSQTGLPGQLADHDVYVHQNIPKTVGSMKKWL